MIAAPGCCARKPVTVNAIEVRPISLQTFTGLRTVGSEVVGVSHGNPPDPVQRGFSSSATNTVMPTLTVRCERLVRSLLAGIGRGILTQLLLCGAVRRPVS
jgi:hypothetical protein